MVAAVTVPKLFGSREGPEPKWKTIKLGSHSGRPWRTLPKDQAEATTSRRVPSAAIICISDLELSGTDVTVCLDLSMCPWRRNPTGENDWNSANGDLDPNVVYSMPNQKVARGDESTREFYHMSNWLSACILLDWWHSRAMPVESANFHKPRWHR